LMSELFFIWRSVRYVAYWYQISGPRKVRAFAR
jgi:hypothetical protein